MKKIILEEVDRIREIMGFRSLITEGIGDEILGAIGKLTSDTKGRQLVDEFVTTLRQADGVSKYLDDAGKPIESWFELSRIAGRTPGKTVDDIIPNFTDDLIEYFLFKSTPENAQMFRKAATDAVFPSALLDDFPSWKSGAMTPQSAKEFTDDMKAIADGIEDPYIKNAVENTGIMKQIRGTASRDADTLLPNNPAQLSQEVSSLKQNSLKKDYQYTERDWEILNMAKNSGELSKEEFEKIGSRRVPKFGEMSNLYNSYRQAAKKGGKNSPKTFEEYLIKELEYKLPSKLTQINLALIKKIAMPLETLLGGNTVMTKTRAAIWLAGFGLGGPAGAIILDLANAAYGTMVKGADKTEDLNYAVNAPLAWEEYWKQDDPQKSLDGGETNDNVYAQPDGYNIKFADTPPKIKIISSDQNIVKIIGDKISLGGKMYDTVYFRMAFEVGGKGESSMIGNVSVIEPFEASPANAGAGTQQQQQQQQTQQQTFAKWIKETMDYDPSDYKITSGSDADGTVTIDVDGTEYTANLIDNKWQWN